MLSYPARVLQTIIILQGAHPNKKGPANTGPLAEMQLAFITAATAPGLARQAVGTDFLRGIWPNRQSPIYP